MSNPGRKLRRQRERQARIEENRTTVKLKQSDITQMKQEIREDVSVFSVDMLLTCIALTEHRLYGFGLTRVKRTLDYIDELMGAINDDEATMEDYVQALRDELGLEIRSEGRKY